MATNAPVCKDESPIELSIITPCFNEQDTIEIDSRTSDAIAMAVRFGCPIYTYEHILQNAGILLEETDENKRKKGVEDYEQYLDSLNELNPLGALAT